MRHQIATIRHNDGWIKVILSGCSHYLRYQRNPSAALPDLATDHLLEGAADNGPDGIGRTLHYGGYWSLLHLFSSIIEKNATVIIASCMSSNLPPSTTSPPSSLDRLSFLISDAQPRESCFLSFPNPVGLNVLFLHLRTRAGAGRTHARP